ncbi:MAG: protein kinase domain-containing protein [Nannocystales bacterium]
MGAAEQPADSASTAERLIGSRYRILGTLGEGGMGAVHRVQDITTGRIVALKTMSRDHDGRGLLRFRREFHSLAHLVHPRIIEAYNFGIDDSGPFYTMELLEGADLKDMGRQPWSRACSILRDVAAALALLHARGMIHRDIAPRNVRCTPDGHAKLFDFGLLATVGLAGDVAGTPACIAPENLRGLPLDDRTDLYGLGTLAYWMLTGRYPYQPRSLADLETMWRRPPPALEAFDPDIPEQLRDLVGRMLCLDPLGRPANAAEVIDRLQAVAELPEEPGLLIREGYLASAAMVGRRREMELFEGCTKQARQGHGRAVFVEAPTGTGKSRLLAEFGLTAQLAGMTALSASAESARWDSYGVIRGLVEAAIAARPDDIPQLPRPAASVLARVFEDLADKLGEVHPTEAVAEPAEERLRIQGAMTQWLVALATVHPVALFVDDVQRCDEASAAVLAALARGAEAHALLVVAALRTQEDIRAPAAVDALREADVCLRLQGLQAVEVSELARSLFGDAPHVERLAEWLLRSGGGSPLHCTELARMLVDEERARLVDGEWILPTNYDDRSIPPGLVQAMDRRVARLSSDARRVAEILAVTGRDFDLSWIRGLLEDAEHDDLFAAIDELVQESVLVGDGEHYAFRHDGLREAVLRGVTEPRAAELHGRVGEALQAAMGRGEAPDREAEVGFHLLRSGHGDAAAEYLAKAGTRLFEVQALSDCIAPLEAAVGVYERTDPERPELLQLRFMLVAAGWISDRAAGQRHMLAAVTSLRDHAGITHADRVGRVLGRHLGLIIGFGWASVAWLFRARARRGPPPWSAVSTFAVTIGYACAMEYANHSLGGLQRLIDLVRPLSVFKKSLGYAVHLGLAAFPDLLLGRLADAHAKLNDALELVENDTFGVLSDFERRFSIGGIRSLIAQIQVTNLDPKLEENLQGMRDVNLLYHSLVADTFSMAAMRFRGREREAKALGDSLEAVSVQLGSWSTDVQHVLFSHPGYGLCGDVLGLKRMADKLERLCGQGFDFRARLSLTRGEYHRCRGELGEAKGLLEQALTQLHDDEMLTRVWIEAALAEVLLGQGEPVAAQDVAERVVERAESGVLCQRSVEIRANRALALAEAEQGLIADAVVRLDRVIEWARDAEAVALVGLCHETRARVSLMADDYAGFLFHSAETSRWLRPTGNTALIAVAEKLVELAAGPDSDTSVDAAVSDSTTAVTTSGGPSGGSVSGVSLADQRGTVQ